MAMNNVTLSLPTIIQALFPPDDVKTVPDYQTYLRNLLGAQQAAQPKKRGRPVSIEHPNYSSDELTQIFAKIKEAAAEDEEAWQNERGRPVRLLHHEQPDDATLVRLDNGIYAKFVIPPETDGGVVDFPMEPIPYVAE